MTTQIRVSVKNYERLGRFAKPFEGPDEVLTRVLEIAEERLSTVTRPPDSAASRNTSTGTPGDWIPLSKLIEVRRLREVRNQAPPESMRFPDGEDRPISEWLHVQLNVAQWCAVKGKLTAAQCPLVLNRATLVNRVPERKDGGRFGNPKEIGVTGLWIEGQYNAKDQVKYAVDILTALGVDPSSVEVEVRP